MSVFSFVARMIEDALARWKVPAGQLDGELVAANLPPTGNTGSGYTPASHTHPLSDLEQGGANIGDVPTWNGSEYAPAAPTGGGAPADATYIVQTANGTLTNEQALSALGTGLLKNTTGTGVLSIATANTDYAAATHATRHQSGGADAIKLDDLAAPDDNTDLNATTSAHGLLPKLDNNTSNFLRGDGSWAVPPGTGGAWTLLATGQLGADGSISLTSISGSYKHLKLIVTLRTTQSVAQSSFLVRVNNDTTAGNYHGQRAAFQNGTFPATNNGATATLVQGICPGDTALANSFAGFELWFHDYADTGKIKTCATKGGYWQATSSSSGSVLEIDTGGWNSTSAITRIDVVAGSGSLKTGCSYELYGVS